MTIEALKCKCKFFMCKLKTMWKHCVKVKTILRTLQISPKKNLIFMWHNDISMKTIQRLPLDFRVTSHYEHLGTFYQQFYCNIDLMIPINSSVETNDN